MLYVGCLSQLHFNYKLIINFIKSECVSSLPNYTRIGVDFGIDDEISLAIYNI